MEILTKTCTKYRVTVITTLHEVLIDKTTRQTLYFFCIQKNIWTSFILTLA